MEEVENSIRRICTILEKQEEARDGLLRLSREIIRECAKSVKAMHAGEMKEARERVKKAEKLVKKARKEDRDFEHVMRTAYQEYTEARMLLSVIEGKKLPSYQKLGIPYEAYLLGLLDLIGELRREMLEAMKKGDRKGAKRYFEKMDKIYEALLPIRFSNSLLPGFRVKQDMARRQVEQARSELLR